MEKNFDREQQLKEQAGVAQEVKEEVDDTVEPDIQKIYVKDFGNLVLEVKGSNEIGLLARSEKRKEDLFIPWTSIMMCSKLDEGETHDK